MSQFQIVADSYTAYIETYSLAIPTADEFLANYGDSIAKAIEDGGFKIDWRPKGDIDELR